MDPSLLPFVKLGLTGLPAAYDQAPRVQRHARKRYDKMRGRNQEVVDESIKDRRTMEEKGLVLRKRSEVASDEEIVEVVRHRGQRLPRRPGLPRQASSMDDIRTGRNNNRQVGAYRGAAAGGAAGGGGDWSESEGSVPPQSRKGRGRAKSVDGKSNKKRDSSTSSSQLGSTTDDEKKCRKMKRTKWITAGLAGVATIHAASNVYGSIERHDKRIQQVQDGEISPEEAAKKQRQARWQDAASIAIAALGIKGALSEWKEVQEKQHEHRELLESREERHKKRIEHERRKKARQNHDGYYKARDGNWYYDGQEKQGDFSNKDSRSKSRGRGSALKSAVEDF